MSNQTKRYDSGELPRLFVCGKLKHKMTKVLSVSIMGKLFNEKGIIENVLAIKLLFEEERAFLYMTINFLMYGWS